MAGQKHTGDFDCSESQRAMVHGPSCKKTPKRQVTKATFEKWQRDDHDHQTLMRMWLRVL